MSGTEGWVKRQKRAGLTFGISRLMVLLPLLVTLVSCAVPRPTIKIALVAPFEGRFRELGYDAFPAMRLVLREQILAGGIGDYQVEFVAYNDNADPTFAERVAHDVVLDERVVAVIGHFRPDTTLAAAHVYTAAQLALLVPQVPADQLPVDPLVLRLGPSRRASEAALVSCGPSAGEVVTVPHLAPFKMPSFTPGVVSDVLRLLPDFQASAVPRLLGASVVGLCFASDAPYPRDLPAATQALAAFREVSGGFAPAPRSISAYDATRVILRAIRADIGAHGVPTRAGVADALRHVEYDGLLGHITFGAKYSWEGAPVWVYQYDAAMDAHLIKQP
jgi:ABC-type branched-subunit amino acid transport system substrate-binding protein